jgi:TorA maturation chaperone TorD
MNHNEIALARSRAYSLFSHLLAEGLTEDSFSIVKTLPEFADLEAQDEREWAAAHYQLFRMNVFPYETIFLGEDGLLGGRITETVASFYSSIGFSPSENDSADSIAIELSALAFLCAAESDAHNDDMPHEAQGMKHFQGRFLDEHLLCWLPALVKAISNQGNIFYSILADMLLKLVLDHRATIGDDLLNPLQSFTLCETPKILSEDKTGLKDIAEYLLIPAYSGFYLSQEDIRKIGNRFRLPRGFGKRLQVLTNLLRTAADYEILDSVLDALYEFAADWRDFYEQIESQYSIEAIASVISVWDKRLLETQELLEQIKAALEQEKLKVGDTTED